MSERRVRVDFTRTEASVVLDTLERLVAYTVQEMGDHLDWDERQIQAWDAAIRKVERALDA